MSHSTHVNTSAKSLTELKGIYRTLFNQLSTPNLTKLEAQQILLKLAQVRGEMCKRFDI